MVGRTLASKLAYRLWNLAWVDGTLDDTFVELHALADGKANDSSCCSDSPADGDLGDEGDGFDGHHGGYWLGDFRFHWCSPCSRSDCVAGHGHAD